LANGTSLTGSSSTLLIDVTNEFLTYPANSSGIPRNSKSSRSGRVQQAHSKVQLSQISVR
jgi:hypothetical protein